MSGGSTLLRGSGNRYTQLVAEALQLTHLPERTTETLQRAEDNLRRAIALCPERRDGHGILAQLITVKDHNEATLEFLRTIDLSIRHDELWAKSVVSVFEHFQSGALDPSSPPRPAWWTDETLKSWALEATQILPEFEWRAERMLAIVMSAPVYPWRTWEPGERDADELRTAAASFQRIVKLVGQARKGSLPVRRPLHFATAPQRAAARARLDSARARPRAQLTSQPELLSLTRIRDKDAKLYIELALRCRRAADGLADGTMTNAALSTLRVAGSSGSGGGAAPPPTVPAEAQAAAPSE